MESKLDFDLKTFLNTKPLSVPEAREKLAVPDTFYLSQFENKSANENQTDEKIAEKTEADGIITEMTGLSIKDQPKTDELAAKQNDNGHSNENNLNQPMAKVLKQLSYDAAHKYINHRVSIAPMLDITNTHYRTFARLMTSYSMLYTEMIHCDTILNSKFVDAYLTFDPVQHPVVLQLGGSNPEHLAKAAKLAVDKYGYDEINLNCGCPSPRVTCGSFGACLMKEPELVVECINAIKAVVKVPVHIKCRLGVDEHDSYEFARNFIATISAKTNMDHFIIHARKAFLKGLNPKENRTVPPLKYDYVYQLAADFPHVNFSINGGIKTIPEMRGLLERGDLLGCMIGRVAYENIWTLAKIDRDIFGAKGPGYSRREVLLAYGQYCDDAMKQNPAINYMTLIKPMLSLFTGEKGATLFRRLLSERHHYEAEGSVAGVINKLIKEMESINIGALDERVQ
jgi:tRNA-dihydrouridine synthase A